MFQMGEEEAAEVAAEAEVVGAEAVEAEAVEAGVEMRWSSSRSR